MVGATHQAVHGRLRHIRWPQIRLATHSTAASLHGGLVRAEGAITADRGGTAALLDALVASTSTVTGCFSLQIGGALEAFLSSKVATILEHIPRIWVKCPERAVKERGGKNKMLP